MPQEARRAAGRNTMMAAVADYFAVFGVPATFALDAHELERRYLEWQTRVHPDRHAGGDADQRRAAVAEAARINEAYRNLKDPIARSTHLLALRGVDVLSAGAPVPADFLMQQMGWHEELDAARRTRDQHRLARLADGFRDERERLVEALVRRLDQDRDDAAGVQLVRQLMFLRRLIEQAQAAAEEWD
jgi:molecular chaperone HscB